MDRSDAIEKGMASIASIGCDRVITTSDGGSVPYQNAINEYGIDVEIIFIRDDGWTLGCHRTKLSNAYPLWKDEWVAVLIKPMSDPLTIEYFLEIGDEGLGRILPPLSSIPPRVEQPKFLRRRGHG